MWLDLLKQAVERTNTQVVADELGISRTVVSLILNDKYPAKTDKVAEKVLAVYSRVECPHTGENISMATCKTHHTSAAPTSSPRAMRLWRACQSCPNNTGEQHADV